MEADSKTDPPAATAAVAGNGSEDQDAKPAAEAAPTHPLEHRWTLWFDNPQQRGKGGGGWGNSLRPIYTFGTVEEFWW